MLPVSQILERNIALFDSGKWLIVNPEESSWLGLCKALNFTVLHQFYDVFQQCTGFNAPLEFDSENLVSGEQVLSHSITADKHTHIFAPYIEEGDYDNIVICIPKSKAHLQFLIDMATARLKDDGQIYLVGENRSGIKSIAKMLKNKGDVVKLDSARHCTLISYSPNANNQTFCGLDKLSVNTYTLNNVEWKCSSFPGVFSDGKLDEGTALLLSSLNFPSKGKSLDFACGAGVISAYLMQQAPQHQMDLSDVSAVALLASAHTLHHNGLKAKVIASNGLKHIKSKYTSIVTNPPFHTGVHTDYNVVTAFIKDAITTLAKDGKLFLVANRFLPYLEQLQQHFKHVDISTQNTRFSVYVGNKGQ